MRSGHYVALVRRKLPPPDAPQTSGSEAAAGETAEATPAQEQAAGACQGPGASSGAQAAGLAKEGSTDPQLTVSYRWYCVSDLCVSPISEARVLASQAYVLLYEAVPG